MEAVWVLIKLLKSFLINWKFDVILPRVMCLKMVSRRKKESLDKKKNKKKNK